MKALALVAATLALAATAGAATRPTLADLEDEVVCPTCRTTLDQSQSPIAGRMRRFIRARIAAGDTKAEIKAQLAARFGSRAVEPAPPREGFDLLAWLLPIAVLAAGAGAVAVLAWRWSRVREPNLMDVEPSANGRRPLEPELERRVDAELARFDE